MAGGSNTVATAAEAPCYSGAGLTTTGNSYDNSCGTLVNFLTNQPRVAARPFDSAAVSKQYLRDKIYSGYVQDDWRFRPSLTLNLGLRYEVAQLDAVSEPWYDLRLNKGLSAFDVRLNLVVNGMWNVPALKTLGGFGERALGGWQLGFITTLTDGVPATPQIASDLLGEVIPTVNSGNLVPGCSSNDLVNANYRHGLFYINPNCISLVPKTADNAPFCDRAGRGFSAALASNTCANIRGNLGRNTIIGPGLFNVDFSVFKNNRISKISETANLQFRAEFFNVLNRTNFAPTSNLSPFNANGTPNTFIWSTHLDAGR